MKKLLLLTALCAAWCAQAQKPNIVGRVTCKGKPVAGVVVSDGELVVRTDSDGRYEMSSSKPCGYVFMSIPGGYETAADGLIPRFFGYTTHCDLDVIDFQLENAATTTSRSSSRPTPIFGATPKNSTCRSSANGTCPTSRVKSSAPKVRSIRSIWAT